MDSPYDYPVFNCNLLGLYDLRFLVNKAYLNQVQLRLSYVIDLILLSICSGSYLLDFENIELYFGNLIKDFRLVQLGYIPYNISNNL